MKRFLCLILVVVITISLFVSCDLNNEQPEETTAPSSTVEDPQSTVQKNTSTKSSSGLEFRLNPDGKSYTVTGIGSCAKDNIVIGSYKGLPVTVIGDSAFKDCTQITGVVIKSCVREIERCAFEGCSELKNVSISANVREIGVDAFNNCPSLECSEFNNALYIGNFSNPYFLLVRAKSSDIYSCRIHPETKIIGSKAFQSCQRLENIKIPDGVISIGGWAFCSCTNLQSVSIPDSVMSIYTHAFYHCPDLGYSEYDNARYLGNLENPYLYLARAKDLSITSCSINPNTRFIGSEAFYNCTNLTGITIPEGVVSIEYMAFDNCQRLASISIPETVTSMRSSIFFNCLRLTSITLPDSLIHMGSLFSECTNLTSITIPSGITRLYDLTFVGCEKLKTIDFKGTKAQWNAIPKDESWDFSLRNCTLKCTDGDILID